MNLTDEDGAVVKSYTYDAFGVEQNIDDADTNAFRYCGEYFDSETGTIYLRARYYDPTIGRFISRDSYAGKISDPLSLNRYTYCNNNPVIFIDPSGNYGVIIYGTYPNEDHSTEDNMYQAGVIEQEFKEKYGECQVYSVNSAQEFVDTWNSLDDSNGIDEIEFIGHGTADRYGLTNGIGYIYFGDGSRLFSSNFKDQSEGREFFRVRNAYGFRDQTIADVQQKNVSKIYFSACNTANPDFKINIAQAFAQKNSDSLVTGWDGGVYFRRTFLHFFTANWDEAMGGDDQHTFDFFRDPSDKRDPGKKSYSYTRRGGGNSR